MAKGLNLASLRRVTRLWQEPVQRLTLADLKALGDGRDEGQGRIKAAQRTHWELKVRIAHRLRDFLFLPYKVMANPSVRLLYEKYADAYTMHEDFGELSSLCHATKYWLALAAVFQENQHITRLLGHGRYELVSLDPELASTVDAFFDRFFVSRIGTHLLGAHFLNLGPMPEGARKPGGVAMGVLQPTSPAGFVRDLSTSLAASGRSSRVPVDVEDAVGAPILYIPGHLRAVLREVLQNAMTATASVAREQGREPAPVRVRVNRGQFGVFVTVSDRGGGIPCLEKVWRWGRDPSEPAAGASGASAAGAEEPTEAEASEDGASVMAQEGRSMSLPLGFGLPLARLTARYFGGDVRLQTLVGYGTNAYIHIPELEQEGAVVVDDMAPPC